MTWWTPGCARVWSGRLTLRKVVADDGIDRRARGCVRIHRGDNRAAELSGMELFMDPVFLRRFPSHFFSLGKPRVSKSSRGETTAKAQLCRTFLHADMLTRGGAF